MVEKERQKLKDYRLRAKLPKYFRIAAVGAIAVSILAVVAGFYRARSNSPFRLKSEHAQLSDNVIAEVTGYERLETEDGVSKYYIKADYAKTFSDNHQELTNMYLETYGKDGLSTDKMSAESALYIPEQDKNFTAYLKNNVQIETHDALKIKTEHIVYTKRTDIAEADEAIAFERDTVRGKSFGANVDLGQKRIELLKDVEIETFDSPELAKSNVRYAKINSNSATYDQVGNKIDFTGNVAINMVGSGQNKNTDIHADRVSASFAPGNANNPKLKRFELFDNVRIVATAEDSPTNIESGYALYDKDADRYELKKGVHILTTSNNSQTEITAAEAIFEQTAAKLALTGDAQITQNGDRIKGDRVFANLFPDNKIKDAVVRGNASAVQVSAERTTSIAAPELNVAYNDSRQLKDANAVGQSTAEVIPADAKAYSRVSMSAARGIGLLFKGAGIIDSMKTGGRTTIRLDSASGTADAANKSLTADTVSTFFSDNGKDIRKAEAVGNAELLIEPLVANPRNYRTKINSPRFDCEFFPTGNNAKTCVAGKNVKTVRLPMVKSAGRGDQTMTSDQLTAKFSPNSNDIESLTADGDAKYSELERHAIARRIVFTDSDGFIRLRGGEPTVWNSSARAKANEIDWDTRNNRSALRGSVSTTYYSQRKINDASPFASADKPIFLTAATAEFDHNAETATYTGNARGWQENNYVRGDKILIDQAKGVFLAEGNVASVLYNARLKRKGKESVVPTSASAGSLVYDRSNRILRYRNNVDIRQGTERITAGIADIYLDSSNEVAKTVTENNVVITQPGRRASGDWAQYTAGDEMAILRGNPASISDAENGSSQSGQLTFSMRENRVTVEGKTKQNNSGRSRTVYKIKN